MTGGERMCLPEADPAWHDVVFRRVSRRRFDRRPPGDDVLRRLEATCARLGVTPSGARAVLVHGAADDLFTGAVGAYGAVKGAPALVAFVGARDGGSAVEVGWIGEAVVLDATLAGLDTCWVAGTFRKERTSGLVELAGGESVVAVTPVGHATGRKAGAERLMRGVVRAGTRLELGTVAPGAASWPEWARSAAEAVRVAPSGGNGQPWRLRMEDGSLVVARKPEKPYWTWEYDCGIAMLHADLGAASAGVRGMWERLSGDDVARFVPA